MPHVRRVVSIEERDVYPPPRQGPLRPGEYVYQPLNFFVGLPVLVPADRAWPGLRQPETQRVITVEEEPIFSDEHDSDSSSDASSSDASSDADPATDEEYRFEVPSSENMSSEEFSSYLEASGEEPGSSESQSSSSESSDEGFEYDEEEYQTTEASSRQRRSSIADIEHHGRDLTVHFRNPHPSRYQRAVFVEPKVESKPKNKAGKVVCLKELEKMAKARREQAARATDTDTGFDADTSSEDDTSSESDTSSENDLPERQPTRAKIAAKSKRAGISPSSSPSSSSSSSSSYSSSYSSSSSSSSDASDPFNPFAALDEETSDDDKGASTADEATTLLGETSTEEATQTEGETTEEDHFAPQNGRAQPAEPAINNNNNDNVGPSTMRNERGFTASEDAILVAMKEGGETWAAIGQALKRGKKELQRRWRELQEGKNQGSGQGSQLPAPAGRTAAVSAVPAREAPAKGNVQNDSTNQAGSERSSDKKPQNADKGAQGARDNSRKGRGPRGGSSYRRAAPRKTTAAQPSPAFEEKNYYDTYSDSELDRDELYTAMYGRLYTEAVEALEGTTGARQERGDKKKKKRCKWLRTFGLRPDNDNDLDDRDCRLLHAIDSERRVRHWLEVQAAFHNVTGRMVHAQTLRRKVEGDHGDNY